MTKNQVDRYSPPFPVSRGMKRDYHIRIRGCLPEDLADRISALHSLAVSTAIGDPKGLEDRRVPKPVGSKQQDDLLVEHGLEVQR